jgi:hypothetical protein
MEIKTPILRFKSHLKKKTREIKKPTKESLKPTTFIPPTQGGKLIYPAAFQRSTFDVLQDMKIARKVLSMIESEIYNRTEEAISIYGNLRRSGRHIVWDTTKH